MLFFRSGWSCSSINILSPTVAIISTVGSLHIRSNISVVPSNISCSHCHTSKIRPLKASFAFEGMLFLGFMWSIDKQFYLKTLNYETPLIPYIHHKHDRIQKAPYGAFCMKTFIKLHDDILTKVTFFSKQLKLKLRKSTGRPLAITGEETIALALFKQNTGIPTKKKIFEIFKPKECYKTLCVEMNRFALQALLVLHAILKWNQKNAHVIKHTDSTDIPVCLNKNATYHKTMKDFASWGHSGKGFYYGLKMSITIDLNRKLL